MVLRQQWKSPLIKRYCSWAAPQTGQDLQLDGASLKDEQRRGPSLFPPEVPLKAEFVRLGDLDLHEGQARPATKFPPL